MSFNNLNYSQRKINGSFELTELQKLSTKKASRAEITHKKTDAYGDTLYYDVIKVSGDSKVLRKRNTPGSDSEGIGTRITAKMASEAFNTPVVINADNFMSETNESWTSSALGKVVGLNIVDGEVYGNWDESVDDTAVEALVFMKDGSFKRSIRANDLSSGKTGNDWLREGALWSVSGRGFVLFDGENLNYPSEFIAGRTIIGIDENRELVIILVYGISNESGIDTNKVGELAQSEGCISAFMADGGSSSQCWWGDCYALPASNLEPVNPELYDSGRKVASFLCLEVQAVPTYDSGYVELGFEEGVLPNDDDLTPMSLRQIGSRIYFQASASFDPILPPDTLTKTITSIPQRYLGTGSFAMNGFLPGFTEPTTSGNVLRDVVPIISTDEGVFSVRLGDTNSPARNGIKQLHGNYSWQHRFS